MKTPIGEGMPLTLPAGAFLRNTIQMSLPTASSEELELEVTLKKRKKR